MRRPLPCCVARLLAGCSRGSKLFGDMHRAKIRGHATHQNYGDNCCDGSPVPASTNTQKSDRASMESDRIACPVSSCRVAGLLAGCSRGSELREDMQRAKITGTTAATAEVSAATNPQKFDRTSMESDHIACPVFPCIACPVDRPTPHQCGTTNTCDGTADAPWTLGELHSWVSTNASQACRWSSLTC